MNKELENKLAKNQWVRIKENGEIEPLFYVSKNKIREIINKYGYEDVAIQKILELLEE